MLSVLKATLLLSCPLAAIASSLYIPGIDDEPFSVSELGSGDDGRTTWKIQQGTPTGTLTDTSKFKFPGTGTLVEGPTDAVLSAVLSTHSAEVTVAVSCSINNGLSVCNEAVAKDGKKVSDITTETASSILVEGGPATSAHSPSSSVTTGAPVASPTNSPAAAGSSPSGANLQPTATPKNAAVRAQVTGAFSVIIALIKISVAIL